MTIPDAPLQLRDYVVTAIEYRRRPVDADPAGHPLSMRFETGGTSEGDTTYLILRIWINEDEEASDETVPNPHEGYLEVRGEFEWTGPQNLPGRDKLIAVNGLSILYGIARVYVAQASGTGVDRRLLLPSVSFHEIDVSLSPPVSDPE